MTVNEASPPGVIFGVLLAAGSGTRFGGDKLLARFASGDVAGEPIGVVALRHLRVAVSDVIAVVRDDDRALAAELGANGARVVRCANADDGLGASLAYGVQATAQGDGWLCALPHKPGDEPPPRGAGHRAGARLACRARRYAVDRAHDDRARRRRVG